ncbi:helix-turn-helix transcriptional regulator [Dactylosporangium sp. NPDC000555]|uniref:response regulator transcription factor n=1 Tax=Dactylosporangium sp. NPDC000555 TaxID=3154260 RepID=UPI00331A325D
MAPQPSANAVHLSPRQHQIVYLLAEGKSGKEIASALGLSPATVRTYLQRLYRRYGLQGRTHAVAVTLGAV